MGRKAQTNYVEAALTVLNELGGGPISTKTLVAAAQERGLVGDGKWVYHNFTRKVRESSLFNTSVRGEVSLMGEVELPPLAEPEGMVESEPVAQEDEFPGPSFEEASFGN